MTKVLLLHGSKQSGKTSAANYIVGEVLKKVGVISKFSITENGQLVVPANTESGEGILDLQSRDLDNVLFYSQNVWPHIKVYNFADELKRIAMDMFELTYEQCYGTDEEKNTNTKVYWKDFCGVLSSRGIHSIKESGKFHRLMSAREFMQFFGTEVCRKIYPGCHAKNVIRRIREEKPDFAVIADLRFYKGELDLVKEYRSLKSNVIKFTKTISEEVEHESENPIKTKYIDETIDNTGLTIYQKNEKVYNYLKVLGWV